MSEVKDKIDTEKFSQARELIRKIDDKGCKGCLLYALEMADIPCGTCISGFTEAQISEGNLSKGTCNRIGIIDLIDMVIAPAIDQ